MCGKEENSYKAIPWQGVKCRQKLARWEHRHIDEVYSKPRQVVLDFFVPAIGFIKINWQEVSKEHEWVLTEYYGGVSEKSGPKNMQPMQTAGRSP
jgi:hypothetical protein